MRMLRILYTPHVVAAALVTTYMLIRFGGDLPTGVLSSVLFVTFSSIELVTTVWLLLQRKRDLTLILAHAANTIGAFLIGFAGTQNDATLLLATGTAFFAVGMLLWVREVTQPRATSAGP